MVSSRLATNPRSGTPRSVDRQLVDPQPTSRVSGASERRGRTRMSHEMQNAWAMCAVGQIFGADETTTVQLKRGETVANTAQSVPTTPKGSGAHRVHKIFSRIYGSLAILLGFFGISLGVF